MTRTVCFLSMAVAIALTPMTWGADAPSGVEDVLQSLPKPPEWPASLFAPAPPPSASANPSDRPYFLADPLLDPCQLPPPGWFADAELDVLKPHVVNQLTGSVQNAAQVAAGTSTIVALPGAPLEWTASPKISFGYRLPSGFGEVLLAYRGLWAQGSENIAGVDGPESLRSRLTFNIIDLDYASREFSLWPKWDMKWTFGVRTLFVYLDSQTDQPFAQPAVGSGITQSRETNHFTGVGPHAGLELSHRIADTGLAFVFRTDFASVFGHIHQGFLTESTAIGSNGQPLAGETGLNYDGNLAILNSQVGLSWQPQSYPCARFFVGYQYEYWWRVSGNGNAAADQGSRADLWDQGIVLQAGWRY
jgi:hypothetical protein